MKKIMNKLVDALVNSTLVHATQLNDYCQLALKQELSEDEADRLAAIYTKAVSDSLLNFFITTMDQLLAERLGLLNDETIKSHGNQQAWLREHLEQSLFDHQYRLEVQQLLQEQGYYHGPIDGILGQRSCKAFKLFGKSLQKRLKKRGLYSGAIDGELGEKTVTAVRKFQRVKSLKDDGVPGKQTLNALSTKTL
jgi:murein L,D-transpeptidase YcbB/YkuD